MISVREKERRGARALRCSLSPTVSNRFSHPAGWERLRDKIRLHCVLLWWWGEGGGACIDGLLGKSLGGVSGSPGASKRNVDADRNHRNAWIRQTKGRNEWNGAREAGGDAESRITPPGHRRFSQITTETEQIQQRTPPNPPSKFLPCCQKTACIINRFGSERLRSAFSAAAASPSCWFP